MPRRRITFRQLETFEAVARLRSFSRAAETLHLTQPAVSIQIRQVADTLGLPLFEQTGREIFLTAAGEELLAAVRSLDDVWNRLESAIADLQGMKRGRLRVALVTTAKYFLPRMLGMFCRRYPDISVELEIANRQGIIERMRGNQDDLYVMSYPPEEIELVSYPFLDNPSIIFASNGHWAAGRKLSLADLSAEPFILREAGSGSRHVVDRAAEKSGVRLNVKFSLSSNEAIRELVACGLGIGVLSRHALPVDLAAEGLVQLNVAGFPVVRPWVVAHLRSKVLSLPVEAFIEELLVVGADLNVASGGSSPEGL